MHSEKADRISTSRYASGGVLVLTMVVLGMFLVMAIASAALINRQFNQVVNQEQEEQAFQIADAGVNYAIWLMDQGLVDFNNPAPVSDYEVKDQTETPPVVLGTFDLTFQTIQFTPGESVAVRITSVGEDASLTSRRQTIEAVIQSDDLDDFRVVEWDHKP